MPSCVSLSTTEACAESRSHGTLRPGVNASTHASSTWDLVAERPYCQVYLPSLKQVLARRAHHDCICKDIVYVKSVLSLPFELSRCVERLRDWKTREVWDGFSEVGSSVQWEERTSDGDSCFWSGTEKTLSGLSSSRRVHVQQVVRSAPLRCTISESVMAWYRDGRACPLRISSMHLERSDDTTTSVRICHAMRMSEVLPPLLRRTWSVDGPRRPGHALFIAEKLSAVIRQFRHGMCILVASEGRGSLVQVGVEAGAGGAALDSDTTPEISLGMMIGRGSFGVVYIATRLDTNESIAVKMIKRRRDHPEYLQERQALQREINLLARMQHPHIVKYLGCRLEGGQQYVMLELMHGSLKQYIDRSDNGLPEIEIASYSYQLLDALVYLHAFGISHRDIKVANVLMSEDLKEVKLADFGSAHMHDHSSGAKTITGTCRFMAPEIIRPKSDEQYDPKKVDMWAMGCSLIEMATGATPWDHLQYENEIAIVIEIQKRQETPELPPSLSPRLKLLVGGLVAFKPEDRPSAEVAIQHSFFENCRGSIPRTLPPPNAANISRTLLPPNAATISSQSTTGNSLSRRGATPRGADNVAGGADAGAGASAVAAAAAAPGLVGAPVAFQPLDRVAEEDGHEETPNTETVVTPKGSPAHHSTHDDLELESNKAVRGSSAMVSITVPDLPEHDERPDRREGLQIQATPPSAPSYFGGHDDDDDSPNTERSPRRPEPPPTAIRSVSQRNSHNIPNALNGPNNGLDENLVVTPGSDTPVASGDASRGGFTPSTSTPAPVSSGNYSMPQRRATIERLHGAAALLSAGQQGSDYSGSRRTSLTVDTPTQLGTPSPTASPNANVGVWPRHLRSSAPIVIGRLPATPPTFGTTATQAVNLQGHGSPTLSYPSNPSNPSSSASSMTSTKRRLPRAPPTWAPCEESIQAPVSLQTLPSSAGAGGASRGEGGMSPLSASRVLNHERAVDMLLPVDQALNFGERSDADGSATGRSGSEDASSVRSGATPGHADAASCGVGAIFGVTDAGDIVVTRLTPGGSTAASGLVKVDDIVLAVDDVDIKGYTRADVAKMVRGAPGTQVSLLLQSTSPLGEPVVYDVSLVREHSTARRISRESDTQYPPPPSNLSTPSNADGNVISSLVSPYASPVTSVSNPRGTTSLPSIDGNASGMGNRPLAPTTNDGGGDVGEGVRNGAQAPLSPLVASPPSSMAASTLSYPAPLPAMAASTLSYPAPLPAMAASTLSYPAPLPAMGEAATATNRQENSNTNGNNDTDASSATNARLSSSAAAAAIRPPSNIKPLGKPTPRRRLVQLPSPIASANDDATPGQGTERGQQQSNSLNDSTVAAPPPQSQSVRTPNNQGDAAFNTGGPQPAPDVASIMSLVSEPIDHRDVGVCTSLSQQMQNWVGWSRLGFTQTEHEASCAALLRCCRPVRLGHGMQLTTVHLTNVGVALVLEGSVTVHVRGPNGSYHEDSCQLLQAGDVGLAHAFRRTSPQDDVTLEVVGTRGRPGVATILMVSLADTAKIVLPHLREHLLATTNFLHELRAVRALDFAAVHSIALRCAVLSLKPGQPFIEEGTSAKGRFYIVIGPGTCRRGVGPAMLEDATTLTRGVVVGLSEVMQGDAYRYSCVGVGRATKATRVLQVPLDAILDLPHAKGDEILRNLIETQTSQSVSVTEERGDAPQWTLNQQCWLASLAETYTQTFDPGAPHPTGA